jgi:hypothetical protein
MIGQKKISVRKGNLLGVAMILSFYMNFPIFHNHVATLKLDWFLKMYSNLLRMKSVVTLLIFICNFRYRVNQV